uniref:Putative product n=1 Tax=Xenopsylla cheopis TaxID=163159 RepID=A0A6M2DX46_XENCH
MLWQVHDLKAPCHLVVYSIFNVVMKFRPFPIPCIPIPIFRSIYFPNYSFYVPLLQSHTNPYPNFPITLISQTTLSNFTSIALCSSIPGIFFSLISSIRCILLLSIPVRLSIFASMASCSRHSLLRICPIKLAFLLIIVSFPRLLFAARLFFHLNFLIFLQNHISKLCR